MPRRIGATPLHHDYEYEVGKVVKALSVTMKARFAEWISQLPIPEASAIEGKLIHLDPNATFLNFNYTPSLARLYSVPDANILHIHGSSKDLPENLVLGHGWSPQQKGSLNTGIDFEATDPRVMRGNEIIDQYFKQFPGIGRYMDETIAFARENGFVETVTGRRRYIRDIRSSNATVRGAAERNAINTPIQGTAADMIKLAMIQIHRELASRRLKTRMILQVHDELVFDLFKPEQEEVKGLVEEKMKTAIPLDVPIVVEMGVGRNWLEAH